MGEQTPGRQVRGERRLNQGYKRWCKNFFGLPKGPVPSPSGNLVEIKYSADGKRMRCTAWLPAIPEHKHPERHTAHQCKLWAVAGRDKCRHHGGCYLERYGKHGMRSKYAEPVTKKARELRTAPNLCGLDGEVTWLRNFLEDLKRPLDQGSYTERDFQHALKVVAEIRQLVETAVRIEEGMKLTIRMPQLEQLLVQMQSIIERRVEDRAVRLKIAEDLRKLTLIDTQAGPEQTHRA